jgi:hypothetical protein
MAPLLDPRFFPHIVADILTLVDYTTLLSARLVCSAMRHLVDTQLEKGWVTISVRSAQMPELIAEVRWWAEGLRYDSRRRVPSGSIHSSPASCARAVRNVKYMSIQHADEAIYSEVHRLTKNIAFIPEITYCDDHRFPLVGLQLPDTELLSIDITKFCACGDNNISPRGQAESVQLRASKIRLIAFDLGPDCAECREGSGSRLNFDCLISVGLKTLQICCNNPLRILSHFHRPCALRSSSLTIYIYAGPPGAEPAAVKYQYAQCFDIAEDQISVEYDEEEDSDW